MRLNEMGIFKGALNQAAMLRYFLHFEAQVRPFPDNNDYMLL